MSRGAPCLAASRSAGLQDAPSLTPLAPDRMLSAAVRELGGRIVPEPRPDLAFGRHRQRRCIAPTAAPCWRMTWEGWRGGVIPAPPRRRSRRNWHHGACSGRWPPPFAPRKPSPITPAIIPMAGRRAAGLSLWHPGADWLTADPTEPALAYLPSKLWLIGLGNLGQAFAWLLACLPYEDRARFSCCFKISIALRPRTTAHRCCRSCPMSGGARQGLWPNGLRNEASRLFLKSGVSAPGPNARPTSPASPCAASTMRWRGRRLKSPASILSSRQDLAPARRPFAAFRCTPFRRRDRLRQLWSRQVAIDGRQRRGQARLSSAAPRRHG